MGNITGTSGADTLNGTFGDDTITGLGGNDWLTDGAGGNDSILGGAGNDTIEVNGGNNTVDGGTGDDSITYYVPNTYPVGPVSILGGDGNDYLSLQVPWSATGTADLGAGNDTLYVAGDTGQMIIHLGAGQDHVQLDAFAGYQTTIGDFVPGAGGDVFDLGAFLSGIAWDWNGTVNPFNDGYVELVAYSGGSMLLFREYLDGGITKQVLLPGTTPAAFTAYNFGGYDPDGSPIAGQTLTGTAGNDTLTGGAGDDSISGLAGNDSLTGGDARDTLLGGGGNDTLDGGNGYDLLDGGAGNDSLNDTMGHDTLLGGDGDDTIVGGALGDSIDGGAGADSILGGNDEDTVLGGAGNDTIDAGYGNDWIDGGAGNDWIVDIYYDNDTIVASSGGDTIDAGGGNDSISLIGPTNAGTAATVINGGDNNDIVTIDYQDMGSVSVDLGWGQDTVSLGALPATASLTLGGSQDRIVLSAAFNGTTVATVTDFEQSLYFTNDIVDFSAALDVLAPGWNPATDPFAAGFARLYQDSNDVVLELRPNGNATGAFAALRFTGTSLNLFTSLNFNGFDPTAYSDPGIVLNGTSGDDTLNGVETNDTLNGLGGNDWLVGNAGSDSLSGNGGNDTLHGNAGSDTLDGGLGNDSLDGGEGGDLMLGGAGNDLISASQGSDTIDGGDGNDTVEINQDFGFGATRTISVLGGLGDDSVYLRDSGNDTVTIDLGDGNDTLRAAYTPQQLSVTLGGGRDTVIVDIDFNGTHVLTLNDFQPGAGGDNLAILDYLGWHSSGWQSDTNPFTDGYLTLVQDGTDVVLHVNNWGNEPGMEGFGNDLVRFTNTTIAAFTADNFDGNAPDGSPPPGLLLAGTAGDDTLTGGGGNDTIHGYDGNDSLSGGSGSDRIYGWNDNDTLQGNAGNDSLYGGSGNDSLIAGLGNQLLDGQGGNDTIEIGYLANFSATLNETVLGGTGNDYLSYGNFTGSNLTVDMGTGNDTIHFGSKPLSGAITLGAGTDLIEFYESMSLSGSAPVIADFATGAGGDRVNVQALAWHQFHYLSPDPMPSWYNPFLEDDMDLVQSGADVLLTLRGNTLLVFANTTLAAFTADNFDVDPWEPAPANQYIEGTGDDDHLETGRGNDTILGLVGDDTLAGGIGDDSISGFAGDDVLNGGAGNDTLRGGGGNDVLNDGYARSPVDPLDVAADNVLDGGDGNDTINIQGDIFDPHPNEFSRVWGGNGDDLLNYFGSRDARLTANMGDGDDTVNLGNSAWFSRITLGAGSDLVTFADNSTQGWGHTITDFAAGAGGDRINVRALAMNYTGETSASYDPFAWGDMWLVQVNQDTWVIMRGYLVIVLENVQATSLTSDNFDADPLAPPATGLVFDGTNYGEYLTGTGRSDTLRGYGGDDIMFGMRGNDVMLGHGGNDELYGNEGDDTLNGGTGNDTLSGGTGNDSIFGNDGNDSILANAGADTIDGGAGDDTISFESYTLTGGIGDPMVVDLTDFPITGQFLLNGATVINVEHVENLDTGSDRDDSVIFGDASTDIHNFNARWGNDYVRGGAGQDFLGGWAGNDTLYGLDGEDALGGGDGNDLLYGGTGNDGLTGDQGDDTLHGEEGADVLDGGPGNDLLRGGAGADTLSSHLGADTLMGESGDDRLVLYSPGTGDSVNGGNGTDTLVFRSVYGINIDWDLRQTQATGIVLTESGNVAVSNVERLEFELQDGNDKVRLGNTWSAPVLIAGGAGNDRLEATAGNDTIDCGDGNDTLTGNSGNDSITDTAGNNILYGNMGNDSLFGAGRLVGGTGHDSLWGYNTDDTLLGGTGNDLVDGGSGNDLIQLAYNWGRDTIDGGDGDDTIAAISNGAIIYWNEAMPVGYTGSNVIVTDVENISAGGFSNVRIWGSNKDDVIDLSTSSTYAGTPMHVDESIVIDGRLGNDSIVGSADRNSIYGGAGNDTIDGRAGADWMYGGTGNDLFYVDDVNDVVSEAANQGTDTVESQVSFGLGNDLENLVLAAGSAATTGIGNFLDNAITGNANANLLEGRAGNDTLDGGGGNDSLLGGAGNDSILGDAGNDTLDGGTNDDDLDGGEGNDLLLGGDGNDTIDGSYGVDTMQGGLGDDIYVVDTLLDVVTETAGQGEDVMIAIGVVPVLFTLPDNVENAILVGYAGIEGNGLNNLLIGSDNENVIHGGAGADTIYGGLGNDTLRGDAGADYFAFDPGGGIDTIEDFEHGVDVIDLASYGIAGFAGLQAGFNQFSGYGIIAFSNGDQLILEGVTLSNLTAADFVL